jgi:hypothetical protein
VADTAIHSAGRILPFPISPIRELPIDHKNKGSRSNTARGIPSAAPSGIEGPVSRESPDSHSP